MKTALPRWGAWLRTRRRLALLSQADIARICGCSQMTVSNLERGKAPPDTRIGRKVAAIFSEQKKGVV